MRPIMWARPLFHLSGCVIPLVYLVAGKSAVLLVTVPALVAAVLIEALRIKGVISLAFVQPILKKKETKAPTGAFFYLVACLATIILFDRTVAAASMLVLAIADPLSAVIGSRWGRARFFGKSAEGTAVFFFSSLIVLAFFSFGPAGVIAASASATAAELLSARFVDDNLSIPIITGLALTLAG